ncbi:MAG: hypothetical protein ACI4I4_07825 [Acutalibacteraceae bacterium]
MKKFLEYVVKLKTTVCLCFTASVIVFSVIAVFYGGGAISVATVFQLLGISVAASVIQFVAFSEVIIKRMHYALRMCIFLLPFSAVITAFAVIFNWFPIENLGSWITFYVIFILIFIATTIGFEIYFRITGKKYDGLLGEYKRKRQLNSADKTEKIK